jgi:hypothetical protein
MRWLQQCGSCDKVAIPGWFDRDRSDPGGAFRDFADQPFQN